MKDKRWENYELTVEDFPESLQDVAEAIGIENTLQLMDIMGGLRQYIPKPECLRRNIDLARRNERICAEFHGCNKRALARRYGLTETQIMNIVKARRAPDEQGGKKLCR